MANAILAFPNYLDATYYPVVIGGGSWALPVENLKDEALGRQAVSRSANLEDTLFFLDLGTPRAIRVVAIPFHTLPRLGGQYRIRASSTIKFQGATVGAGAAAGATEFTLQAGASDVAIEAGEVFSFAGHDQLYQATADVTILAGNSGTVYLKQDSSEVVYSPYLTSSGETYLTSDGEVYMVAGYVGLAEAITAGEAITCHSGDFSDPEFDSGWKNAAGQYYPWDAMYWGHPSLFTGTATPEQWEEEKFPIIEILSSTYAQYWKFEFNATDSAESNMALPRLFIAPGYQPSINIAYGAGLGVQSDVTFSRTTSKRRVYEDNEITERVIAFEIQNLPQDEALSQALDMQKKLGKSKQLFFVLDPDDAPNLHRTAFLANFAELSPLRFAYFDHADAAFELIEVV